MRVASGSAPVGADLSRIHLPSEVPLGAGSVVVGGLCRSKWAQVVMAESRCVCGRQWMGGGAETGRPARAARAATSQRASKSRAGSCSRPTPSSIRRPAHQR